MHSNDIVHCYQQEILGGFSARQLPMVRSMTQSNLTLLIHDLQLAYRQRRLDDARIASSIESLHNLGYRYDARKFPQLPANTAEFGTDIGDAPSNLAEAMLWKLGKWPSYQSFARNFADREMVVSAEGGVVFSAFAKHLQDSTKPIYDQHAMRALWAIGEFSDAECARCNALLFKKDGSWKDAGSGDDGTCYQMFAQHLAQACHANRIQHGDLDKLLMPLGQAIKDYTGATRQPTAGNHRERFLHLISNQVTVDEQL